MRVVDRIGGCARGVVRTDGPDAGPQIPDNRSGAGAQHAADLGQAGRRVGPVVHRQSADDQSKDRSGNANAATSPTRNSGRRPSPFPRRSALARAIMAGSRSRPVT